MAAQLNEVIETLERTVEVTAGLGLELTAELLRMARLDVLMRLHGIADEELEALRKALVEARNTEPESKIDLRTRSSIFRPRKRSAAVR